MVDTDVAPLPAPARSAPSRLPGLAVAVGVAALAWLVGRSVPLVGAPVLGIVFGAALSGVVGHRVRLRPGIAFAASTVLQLAVVVLGAQLSFGQVIRVGVGSLPVMLGTLTVCLVLAQLVGRWLGLARDTRTLIGVGTAICGASAIAAVSPVIRARSNDIAYAISTIFLFNVAAVLLFPPLGHLLGMSQHSFGLFAGTAVNDTSSVVATATTFGSQAGTYAVVVKLTRTLMIIPICLGLAALGRRREARVGGAAPAPDPRPLPLRVLRLLPWFLVAFLMVAAANSAGLLPVASRPGLEQLSLALITVALSAVGLSTDFAALRRAGVRPLLLGLLLWFAVAATSLALQAL